MCKAHLLCKAVLVCNSYTFPFYNLILLTLSKCQQTCKNALSPLLLYLAVTGRYAGSTSCCKVGKTLQQNAMQKSIRSTKSNGSYRCRLWEAVFLKTKTHHNKKSPQKTLNHLHPRMAATASGKSLKVDF